jgi:phage terminase large subunit
MGELNIPKDAMIYCDAAEPDRIEELQRAGYTVTPAYKGAGSVRAGIDFCQGINIYTKPDNININKESQSYSWRTTRDGSPMDEPVKLNDDAMDAMRYAIYTHIGKPTAELFTFERSQLGF